MINKEINRILVPVSLTREGEIAINQAMLFHEAFSARITILNVIPGSGFLHRIIRPRQRQRMEEKAYCRLRAFIDKYFEGNIPRFVDAEVSSGRLVPAILQTALDLRSDIIIIKKSKKIYGRFAAFRQHNADRLIGEAHCPVLTIKEKYTAEGIRNILIPLDITKKADIKVNWVIFLAQNFKARVIIISVLKARIPEEKSLAFRKAKQIEDRIREYGIECKINVVQDMENKSHDVFLKQAENMDHDLMVIMTHQESILFSDHIGHFAKEIIHRAQQPVFNVVPRKETIFQMDMT